MGLARLSNGEKVAGTSAILLFVFTFFDWYGLGDSEQSSNLLSYLRPLEDGGNAWQTLELTPIFLALVTFATVWVVLLRLGDSDWELAVQPGAVICGLGVVAALLILIRIVFPPDLAGGFYGLTFEANLEAGIFLALAASCGVAIGGCLAMWRAGVSFANLRQATRRSSRAW